MRVFKIIGGLGCISSALFTGLITLFGFLNLGSTETLANFCLTSVLATMTFGLIWAGWHLVIRQNLPLPGKSKALIALAVSTFAGFVVAFAIPGFMAVSLSRSSNPCINNLRQIEAAKAQWALENNQGTNDTPTSSDISIYLLNGKMPACPSGGKYTIGRVGEDPKCSIGDSAWPNVHALNYGGSWWKNFKAAYRILFGRYRAQSP